MFSSLNFKIGGFIIKSSWSSFTLKLKPFNRYGKPIPKLSWHPISYDKKSGQGSYILKFKPGGKSLKHKHFGTEEFLVLEVSLNDSDNTEFIVGDFVSFKSGSTHFSSST